MPSGVFGTATCFKTTFVNLVLRMYYRYTHKSNWMQWLGNSTNALEKHWLTKPMLRNLTRVLQRPVESASQSTHSESSKPDHIIDVRCSRASALEWKLLIKNIAHDSLCF